MSSGPTLKPIDFNPFKGNTIEKVLPVTEAQQEVWLSCKIGGNEANLAYNESISLQFSGKLDERALKDSLKDLVARHESLRCSISNDGSKLIIYKNPPIQLNCLDISSKSKQEQKAILDDFSKKDTATPFNLEDPSLIRFSLFKESDDQYLFSINAHHIVCDGWSFGVLLEDLSAIYNAKCNNTLLQNVPDQFSQYVIDDYEFSLSEEYNQIISYWVNQYQNNVPQFEIPTDFPRTKSRSYSSKREDFTITHNLADSIKKAGAKYGCSFVTTLMSAFEVLIYKLTGQTDIILGLPTAGQSASGLFNVIGHCVNLLPLRSNPKGDMIFSDYLKIRKSQILNDYDHQRFTFGTLLKKINIARDSSRIPLVPLSFNIDIGMDANVSFHGLSYEIIYNPRVSETFEIFLNITNTPNGYIFQWSYNTKLYRAESIKSFMEKYVFLLIQIAENAEQNIDNLKLRDENKIFASISKWNNTYKELPNLSVIQLFEDIASTYPDNIALKFKTEQYSYQELNKEANKFANILKNEGLKSGDVAAFILDRGAQIIITILAILKSGATYLPLDPEFPIERIQFMLDDSEASFLISNDKYIDKFSSKAKLIIFEVAKKEASKFPSKNHTLLSKASDLAYILYTSGSTGRPKGVMVTQNNLLNFITAMKDQFHTNEHTRLLSLTTISFDIVGLEVFLPLISGGTLVLADSTTAKDGKLILENIISEKINFIQATPATYKIMISSGWERKLPITIICGGESLSKILAQQLLQRGNCLYNMYGPTETTIWSTCTQVFEFDNTIKIGKPIQNTQVYILDNNNEIMPEGFVGEIYIGGKGVAKGYYGRPDLTKERFIQNPFDADQESKLYKTGDLGKFLPDGNLICLGRTDQQVKIRGYRIELEEIEQHIAKFGDINEVVIIAKEDSFGENKLVAFIVPKDSENGIVSKDEILKWRSALEKVLPIYMIPSEWIKISEIPMTPNKKVDRKELSKPEWYKHKESDVDVTTNSTTSKLIKRIWEEELVLNGIDEEDDFFQLGGHSLIAVKVMSKIGKETGVKVPISILFENSTIKALTKVIDSNKNLNPSKIVVPIKHSGSKLPIFLVHAGGLNILLYKSLSEFLDEEQPLYGLQGLGLNGDLTHITSIETIAARYLAEIVENDPNGPYTIMGYSFGGIIAYEIVRQLLEQGKKVKMLGILDTYADTSLHHVNTISKYNKKILRQFKKLGFFTKMFFKTPREILKYQLLLFNRKFNKNFRDPEEDQIHDYNEEVIKAYDEAYYKYKMQPINIYIDLFKVQKRIYYLDEPVYLGWKKFALKGIKIHSIPGDHKTFLSSPNNKILANTIQHVVDNKSAF